MLEELKHLSPQKQKWVRAVGLSMYGPVYEAPPKGLAVGVVLGLIYVLYAVLP